MPLFRLPSSLPLVQLLFCVFELLSPLVQLCFEFSSPLFSTFFRQSLWFRLSLIFGFDFLSPMVRLFFFWLASFVFHVSGSSLVRLWSDLALPITPASIIQAAFIRIPHPFIHLSVPLNPLVRFAFS